MNLDNISSEDDSIDNELDELLKVKKSDVPDEFSIDNLLKTRTDENSALSTPIRRQKQENIIPTMPKKEEKCNPPNIIYITSATTTTTTDDELHDQLNLEPLINRDGSIFEFSQSSVPIEVFSYLEKNQSHDDAHVEPLLAAIPKLEKWQYKALQQHPNILPISNGILFSFLLHMIDNTDKTIGIQIIKYWKRFPNNSIQYCLWYELFKKAIYSKFYYGTIILLAISDIPKFLYTSEEERETSPFEIIVLHFYSLLCPEVSEDINYRQVMPTFRKILIDNSSTFSEERFYELVNTCYSLASDCNVSNSFYLISLFPFDGLGCDMINEVMIRLCLTYLRIYPFPDVVTIETVADSMSQIRKLCESLTSEDLLKASAAMALIERILVAAIVKKRVKYDVIEHMSKSLKFSIHCSNPGVLTALKEQIHVTRSQIDCFIQERLI